jgi:hypothetical protein
MIPIEVGLPHFVQTAWFGRIAVPQDVQNMAAPGTDTRSLTQKFHPVKPFLQGRPLPIEKRMNHDVA